MIRKIRHILKTFGEDIRAQAAIIYLYVVGLVVGIAIYIYTSPVMDSFNAWHFSAVSSGLIQVSQNTQDSISITQLAYQDWIIIYFVLLTVAAYAAALKYRSSVA